MRKLLTQICCSFKVVRRQNGFDGKPLPHMVQYYLQNDEGQNISFWNDVPITLGRNSVTTCIEIPKQFNAKFECIKQLPDHPFMQDTRKNIFNHELELRYYAQFPLFNYGYIPQTWEQSIEKDKQGLLGDDDPIDILDLSQSRKTTGSIFQSKVLGGFCLIDQGEVDWKLLTMEKHEADEYNIQSVDDLDPRLIKSIMNWFRITKVFDGKQQNSIAYNNKIFNQAETMMIIKQVHEDWHKLLTSQDPVYAQKRKQFHIQ